MIWPQGKKPLEPQKAGRWGRFAPRALQGSLALLLSRFRPLELPSFRPVHSSCLATVGNKLRPRREYRWGICPMAVGEGATYVTGRAGARIGQGVMVDSPELGQPPQGLEQRKGSREAVSCHCCSKACGGLCLLISLNSKAVCSVLGAVV
jgi:hypothetical protein